MAYSRPVIPTGDLTPPKINIPLVGGLASRGISAATCERYMCYATSTPLQVVYHYATYDDGVVGYKYRTNGWVASQPPKETKWGNGSERCLFGLHLWQGEPTTIYLCEGETDAMSLSECLPSDHLALALGGEPTPQQWKQWLALLASLAGDNPIVTCFDNDSKGDRYRSFTPNLLRLRIPPEYKDFCEYRLAYGPDTTIEILEREYPPSLLWGEELHALAVGSSDTTANVTPTGYPQLDLLIGGYRPGSIVLLAGQPKAGKSSFLASLVRTYLTANPTTKVLYIPLELSIPETLLTLSPDNPLELLPQLVMMRHFGYLPIETLTEVLDTIPSLGITMLVVDHITAACTSFTEGLATKLLDASMSLVQAKLNEYGIPGLIVSHINGSVQQSDMITPQNLRGSLSLAQLPSVVLGIRRLDDGVSEVYTVTPDRYTGRTGSVRFTYDNHVFSPYGTRTSIL
jgi:hypothetical protein